MFQKFIEREGRAILFPLPARTRKDRESLKYWDDKNKGLSYESPKIEPALKYDNTSSPAQRHEYYTNFTLFSKNAGSI